ncbi:hypothetical protein ACVXHA_27265 [Escherichia coli]
MHRILACCYRLAHHHHLSGLMLLTKGVELSGYFDVLGTNWCAALLRSVGWRCLWCWRRRCFLPF